MRRRGNRVSLGVALRPALVLSIVGVVLVSVGAPSIGLAQTVEKSDLPKSGEPTIGVQLAVSPEKVLFGSASGRFRLEAPYNQKGKIDFGRTVSKILEIDRMSIDYRKTQKGSGKYAVAPEAGRQAVQFSDGHPFRLRAEGAPVTEVAGRTYEGWIEMIWIPEAEGAGSWRMVNRVPMERYLMGVLAGEMTAAEPAALQAQAITARSFALYQMLTRAPGSSIHVDSTIRSQKYVGGRPSDAIVDAVERTRGQVLFHQGRLFKVQYHSTCGGSTASGRAVFGLPSIKSLTSVKCPYCKNEPVTRKGWNCTIAEAKIREVVRRVAGAPPHNIVLGRIAKIEPLDKQPGGHACYVRITHAGGRFEMDATEFRNRLIFDGGIRELKSTAFSIEKQGNSFRFSGTGFGHGVGMCQRGAMRAAEQGLDAVQILKFYYRGADVVQLW